MSAHCPTAYIGKPNGIGLPEPLVVDLALERRVAHHAVERQQHRQIPRQLRDPRHLRLQHDRRPLRVDPARQPVLHDLDRRGPDLPRLLRPRRERVHVRDKEVALVFILQPQAILDAPDPVTEMQPARRRISGQDPRLGRLVCRRGVHGTASVDRTRAALAYVAASASRMLSPLKQACITIGTPIDRVRSNAAPNATESSSRVTS